MLSFPKKEQSKLTIMNEISFIFKGNKKDEKSPPESSSKMIDLTFPHLLKYKSTFNLKFLNIYE